MAIPTVVRGPVKHTDEHGQVETVWWIICPRCGEQGHVDAEQYHGHVSIMCPVCDYHETHSLEAAPFRPDLFKMLRPGESPE